MDMPIVNVTMCLCVCEHCCQLFEWMCVSFLISLQCVRCKILCYASQLNLKCTLKNTFPSKQQTIIKTIVGL